MRSTNQAVSVDITATSLTRTGLIRSKAFAARGNLIDAAVVATELATSVASDIVLMGSHDDEKRRVVTEKKENTYKL